MKEDIHILYKETLWESVFADLVTYGGLLVVINFSVQVESVFWTLFAFIMLVAILVTFFTGRTKRFRSKRELQRYLAPEIALPYWDQVSIKFDNSEKLNNLELFIYDYEPNNPTHAREWRAGLDSAINDNFGFPRCDMQPKEERNENASGFMT